VALAVTAAVLVLHALAAVAAGMPEAAEAVALAEVAGSTTVEAQERRVRDVMVAAAATATPVLAAVAARALRVATVLLAAVLGLAAQVSLGMVRHTLLAAAGITALALLEALTVVTDQTLTLVLPQDQVGSLSLLPQTLVRLLLVLG